MRIALNIIGILILLAFIARISITMKPFHIGFERPILVLGMIFFLLGFCCIVIDSDKYAMRNEKKMIQDALNTKYAEVDKKIKELEQVLTVKGNE